MWLKLSSIALLVSTCSGVIYHFNDTEYHQMPPLFGLDLYEPCLMQSAGVYCVVKFNLQEGANDKLINIIRNYSAHTVKHYNHSELERGICITETCKSFVKGRNISERVDIEQVLEECINKSIRSDYGLDVKLGSIYYCDKYEKSTQKDIIDWLVAFIFIVLLVINVIGNLYDVYLRIVVKDRDYRQGNLCLSSFSIYLNWEELTMKPQMERLKSLYGLKSITIFFMVIAHVMWKQSTGFTDNPHDFEKAYETAHYQLIFNGMMIVQIYFVLSGFLMTYNLLIHSEKQNISWSRYPTIVFMRWWRLAPTNAVLLAFTSTWLRHLGSGPLWRMRVADSVVAGCRTYWWSHLLFINNYMSRNRFCAIQTWYIAADMQLYIVGLAVFLAFKSQSKILPLSFLIILGTVLPALHVWLQDLDGVVMMTPEMYRQNSSDTFFLMHTRGHNNLTSFIIGMATGYLVHYMQKSKIDISKNKFLYIMSWFIAPMIISLFLAGRVFYRDDERAHLTVRMAWAGLHRVVMGGIAAFATVSLVMRCNDKICSFLEWPGWTVPGRLSYSVYLLHLNVVHVIVGSVTQLAHVSFFDLIIIHLGVVWLSFIAAVPFYLLVEAPIHRLMKTIMTRQDHNVKTE